MTVAATGARAAGGWPYRRIVLAALAVSVVLNLFFIAGALWTRTQAPPPTRGFEQRYQQMAAELDLDAQQRAAFDRYVAAMRARLDNMRQQVAPLTAAAWEETAKPQADTTRALQLFAEASDKRRQFQQESMAQTLDFLARLSPEQRTKFVTLSRERRGQWRNQAPQSR